MIFEADARGIWAPVGLCLPGVTDDGSRMYLTLCTRARRAGGEVVERKVRVDWGWNGDWEELCGETVGCGVNALLCISKNADNESLASALELSKAKGGEEISTAHFFPSDEFEMQGRPALFTATLTEHPHKQSPRATPSFDNCRLKIEQTVSRNQGEFGRCAVSLSPETNALLSGGILIPGDATSGTMRSRLIPRVCVGSARSVRAAWVCVGLTEGKASRGAVW
ncbi:hypothetical protein KM043_002533 [Ampulex compressa]|nr:hypothetical protein KM043_002533 [Ampulex compressa]